MGRGRQRAKQRKVARNLKYFSPETDYAALERELVSQSDHSYLDHDPYAEDPYESDDVHSDYEDDEEYDAYAEYAAKYGVEDDESDDAAGNEANRS